jgi:pyruvate dehydrogenase (quinone)
MATSYSKWTGRLGCCLATTGPGGIHLLNGLYDAKLDRQPVIAITGLPYHDLSGTFTQQDVDLDKLFSDVAVFSQRVMGAAHVEAVASLACRTAIARRGVSHLSVPIDVQDEPETDEQASPRGKRQAVSNVPAAGLLLPKPEDVDRAVTLLNRASRVAILAGRGALGAEAELERCADLLAAPVAKALLGKAVMDDRHPHCTGGIGLYGTLGTHAAMERCDTLLIVGSTFPYLEYYPKPGRAAGIQIDFDAQRISLRYPVDVGLVGDTKASLEALCAQLQRKDDRSFLAEVQKEAGRWNELLEVAAKRDTTPMDPAVPVAALGRQLADDAVVVTDSGHHTGIVARHLPMRPGMAFGVSGALASMACGLPYAISAAVAYPGRQVVAVIGDGGLAMQLGEFATAVRLNLPILFLVLKNGILGQIKWEQMLFLGNPEFGCTVPNIEFATAAEAMGGRGFQLEDRTTVQEVLAEALMAARSGPVMVEAIVDPNEPLLPAKVQQSYRRHLQKALAAGTPGAEAIKAALRRDPPRTLMEEGEKTGA